MAAPHRPVLLKETLAGLAVQPKGVYVDCTVGFGGHSEALLRAESSVQLIGLDQDPQALRYAAERLACFGSRVRLVPANFRELRAVLDRQGFGQVQGILMDIGVSSVQLDDAARGFSYQTDAPLDMRMDPGRKLDAAELVNSLSEQELGDIIARFGEERWAKRIAKFIVDQRKNRRITTTGELVDVIKQAVPKGARRQGPHPAKRTFQALRIAVNDELGALKDGLDQAVQSLAPGGRLCVITFHSLEDRIVKDTFRRMAQGCVCPPQFPQCVCGHVRKLRVITRKPVVPSLEETAGNPRARSAKLRTAERLEEV